jgi:D-alanyl-D-alanine carboxypeptidase (penicillin-binding protein 5/6)
MRPSLRFFVRSLLILLVPASLVAASARSRPTRPAEGTMPAGGYRGAIVLDAATGRVLFEDNADVVNPPASMTKLMTFAVLYERLASGAITLNTPITVTSPDTKIGGTQVWLKEKETFTVEEMIYAMMIQSANDCAYALGRSVAGSQDGFVELMNAKAKALGMTHTTFRTTHGLPPASRKIEEGDLSSPRDFALLARHLIEKTDVLKYSSVRRRSFGQGVRPANRVIDMVNHNHLLGKVEGVDGLKTGFTNAAGFCLTSTAERNGRRIIVVSMGGTDKNARDLAVAELIRRGFAALASLPPPPPAITGQDQGPSPFAAAPTQPAPNAKPEAKTGAAEEPVIKLNLPRR